MQLRKISRIDEDKCTGCGLCTKACHEGALQLVNGKAKLVSASQCDGLGICLPVCPNGAITLEEESTINNATNAPVNSNFHCPGNHSNLIVKKKINNQLEQTITLESQLQQWPCQIKLIPTTASYFEKADLLIAADCTAYAYANIHNDFMRNKITLIGCPKLDNCNYAEKLEEIFQSNNIRSITVLRMEKPCCSGLVNAAREALAASGKEVPFHFVIIGVDGSIIEKQD
jgi:Pyruvate/2-oxoacid:ferredoxin oxidoreductase delta subunit